MNSPNNMHNPSSIAGFVLTSLFLLIYTCFGRNTSTDEPLKARSLDWVLPNKGTNVQDEIKCYGLPYGGIGFTSHILTYYALLMIMSGISPWTWKPNTHWKFDTVLALISLLLTTITSIITLVHCRNRWEFVCLATWKFCMSLTVTFIALQIALHVRKSVKMSTPKGLKTPGPGNLIFAWFVVYILGLLVGFAGLLSLVKQGFEREQVKRVTLGFACTGLTLVSLVMIVWVNSEFERLSRTKVTSDANMEMVEGLEDSATSDEALFGHPMDDDPIGTDLPTQQIDLSTNDMIAERRPVFDRVTATSGPLRTTQKLESALRNFESFIFRSSFRNQYKAGLRNGLGPLRLLWRVSLYLFLGGASFIGVAGALYSDFVLGGLAGNMSGWPSSDVAVFYWIYFAAKRLPLLFV